MAKYILLKRCVPLTVYAMSKVHENLLFKRLE